MVRWNHRTHCTTFDILSAEGEFTACCLLQFLHHFHHSARHEVWAVDSIVLFAILTEADENGVDCHLINHHEAVYDEEGKDDAYDDGNGGIVQTFCLL